MRRTTHFLMIAGILSLALPLPLIAQYQVQKNQPQQLDQQQQRRAAEPPRVPEPVPFQSKDGKIRGWKVVIPGNHSLATPAVIDGRVFLGGGFGSHEFYAFDAATGKKLWVYQTADDGPTAAAVADGHVAFNTESCELEVLTVDGKPVWKKWLGDPLMSMPAVADGKVYMAYPDSKDKERQHYLASFDLKTGKENWKKPIAGEIITAPVVQDSQVYLTALEGTVYCFKLADGELVWKDKKNVTSAPVVWQGRCYFSQREETTVSKDGKDVKQQNEQMACRLVTPIAPVQAFKSTNRLADYLDFEKRKDGSIQEKAQAAQDATVGFAGGKGDAKIEQAMMNLGRGNVAGVWSYQGSKPFIYNDRLYSAMGDVVKCVDPKSEKIVWSKKLHDAKDKELVDTMLTPPAVVNDKIFVGTALGEVFCLSVKSGDVIWKVDLGEPVLFQPAVARGRVYVSTEKGSLFCLETGDARDDGWLMWGGNSAHNGHAETKVLGK